MQSFVIPSQPQNIFATNADKLKSLAKIARFILSYALTFTSQRVRAFHQKRTYQSSAEAKNVLVLGGSFAGTLLAQRLCESLPTGYRVVMIEKHSHFNYSFKFPRYSVLYGREHRAFIPYTYLVKGKPEGIYQRVQSIATRIPKDHVHLVSGDKIEYTYLAIATETSSSLPAKVVANDREPACKEIRSVQNSIQGAHRIAVLGGGAVGIKLASDIKSFYPEKDVILFHSRSQLLYTFGDRLGNHVQTALRDRNQSKAMQLVINAFSGYQGLEMRCSIWYSKDMLPKVFSLGDVADTGGPKMGRASYFQSEVVLENILAMIGGKIAQKIHKPRRDLKGFISLSLGKTRHVMYCMNNDGSEIMFTDHNGKEDPDVVNAWRRFNSDMEESKLLV